MNRRTTTTNQLLSTYLLPICVAHDALSNYALRSAHTAQIVRCVLYVGYIEFRILRANYVVIKENILPTFGH